MTRGQRDYARHKEAYKERARRLRATDPEKYKAISRAYTSRPDVKEARRLKTYGLTAEGYQAILRAQDFKCAICYTPLAMLPKRQIHIDHDHLLDKVRGILCHYCNLGVGNFKDDPGLAESAARYLRSKLNGPN